MKSFFVRFFVACVCLRVRVFVCMSSYVCPETFFPSIKFSIREARSASYDMAELFPREEESEGRRGKTKGERGPGRPKNNTPRYNAKVVMRYCNDTRWQFSRHPHRQSSSTPALCRAVAEPVLAPSESAAWTDLPRPRYQYSY